ncbi:hypothetical protein LTR15_010436 [Elasticomyces elasticus]|nr:hypothetical protein LTR15_010436 [Elasticomyces elasticus]
MSPFTAMDGMLKHMKRVTICQYFFHPNVDAVLRRDLSCVVELRIKGKELQVEVAMSAKGSLRSARMERGGLRTCYPKYENQHQAAAVEIRPAIDDLGKSVQDGGSFSATALADIAGRMARASWMKERLDLEPGRRGSSMAKTTTHSKIAHINTADEVQSHFLGLPRELRNQIYDFALVPKQGFLEHPARLLRGHASDSETRKLRRDARSCSRSYAALSASNHQIGEEARDCFFGKNIFCTEIYFPSGHGGVPPEHKDGRLAYMKHMVLGRALAARGKLVFCLFDVRIKGKEVRSEVVVSADYFKPIMEARYGGVGQVTLASEAQCQYIETGSKRALDKLKDGLEKEGCFSRRLLNGFATGLSQVLE